MTREKKSLYEAAGKVIAKKLAARTNQEDIDLSKTIRSLRIQKGLSGVELCRFAGDLDPKTLTAVEKGRIKNPSIKTLLSISRGLNIPVGNIFKQTEMELERNLYVGSQKGAFSMDFPAWGVRLVSFTPFIKDFFYGKILIGPRRKMDKTFLKHPLPFFVSGLVGRTEVQIEGQKFSLKTGENLFFNGALSHSFYNPLHRESVLLLVTAPSFI